PRRRRLLLSLPGLSFRHGTSVRRNTLRPKGEIMSKSEIQRFVQDLGTNPALLAKAKKGDRFGAAEAVKIGSEHGYGFSLEEAKALIQERARPQCPDLPER